MSQICALPCVLDSTSNFPEYIRRSNTRKDVESGSVNVRRLKASYDIVAGHIKYTVEFLCMRRSCPAAEAVFSRSGKFLVLLITE